jgi:hypothetical protein
VESSTVEAPVEEVSAAGRLGEAIVQKLTAPV